MASKTVTCNGTSGSKYNLTLYYALNSQSIGANTSNITVYTTLKRNDGYAGSYWNLENQGSAKLTIGTVDRNSHSLYIDTRNSKVVELARWTGDVLHEADGSLSISVGGSFSTAGGSALTGGNVSQTWALPTIPRASSFTLSSSSVAAGSSFDITVSPSSSSFTHTATITFGGKSSTVSFASGETVKSFTVPIDWLTVMTNTWSKSATVSLQTRNSGSNVGSAVSRTISVTTPSSAKPTITGLTAGRVDNGVPSSWGVYVQGYSKATLSIQGAATKYGASISTYDISGGGYWAGQQSYTTGPLYLSGPITFAGCVYDSRGMASDSKSATINVLPYYQPYFDGIQIYRCT